MVDNRYIAVSHRVRYKVKEVEGWDYQESLSGSAGRTSPGVF